MGERKNGMFGLSKKVGEKSNKVRSDAWIFKRRLVTEIGRRVSENEYSKSELQEF